jgi:hypothetical protein
MLLHDGFKMYEYNNLPSEIKIEQTLRGYKKQLEQYIVRRERGGQ